MKNTAVMGNKTARETEIQILEESDLSPEVKAILEKSKTTILFPKKYLPAQSSYISEKIKEIHSTTPELPIRQVVVQILSKLPDFLPPDNILDVTRQIVEQWQKLTEGAPKTPNS